MTIIVGEHYGLTMPNGRVLGYMGEHRLRKLLVIHPHFDGAVYMLKLKYPDGVIYQKQIVDGEMEVDGSLLRAVGEIQGQFLAYVYEDDGAQKLVFESEIFTLEIGECLDGDAQAIPTYEQTMDLIEQLQSQFLSVRAKQGGASLYTTALTSELVNAEKYEEE